MKKKVAASVCFFLFTYMNQHNSLFMSLLTKDFFFAGTATAYEQRFGALLPAMDRISVQQTSHVSTFTQLIAEKNGVITKIDKETITIQQEDGTEMEVMGLQMSSFRLFEKIKKGELIGVPAVGIVKFTERKNGQIISTRKLDAYETN